MAAYATIVDGNTSRVLPLVIVKDPLTWMVRACVRGVRGVSACVRGVECVRACVYCSHAPYGHRLD